MADHVSVNAAADEPEADVEVEELGETAAAASAGTIGTRFCFES